MSEARKIVAILVADVVGFSRLAGADEERTLSRLRGLRSDLIDPAIAAHRGRVVKRTGDGALVEFRSVVDSVRCAIEVQSGMIERNAGLPPERRIEFRIGIHLGDVVEESDGDLMGDGVNIAARLEGVASPGAICLSEDAWRQVRARPELAFADLGEMRLKNIAQPIRVYSLKVGAPAEVKPATPASPAVPERNPAWPAPPDKPSIAVLAFHNMSGDPEQEYFADGITEDVITDLSKVSGLFVIARNSSFAYKGKTVDIRVVARELGVRTVLEGSIRRAGNRVRITAQLIDAETGGHLWAERFDRELSDIFAVQDEVTRHIVDALKVMLTAPERTRREHRGKVNAEAYDYTMRARETYLRFTAAAANEARALLDRALEIDAGFAPAYAQLALVYGAEYINGWNEAGPAQLERGIAFAHKARQLDPEEARAHQAVAILGLWQKDHASAEHAARRAIELAPSYSGGFYALGQVLDFSGQHEAAIGTFEQALRLDPGFDLLLHLIGRAQLGAGRHADAENSFKRRLIRNPRSDMSRAYLASIYGTTGRLEEARRLWGEILEINPTFSIEHLSRVLPYKDPAWFARFRDGLRHAGLVGAGG